MSWGVRPRALVGHSLGEYVAACVAGVLRLEDALRLVALRARLIDALPPGAMLAVPLGEAALREILPPALDLAAVNTPESCVVAGPAAEIEAFETMLAGRGTVSRRLPARHAFHSRAMEPAAAELERLVAGFDLRAPEIPFISDVTGTWISDEDARSPVYWARHLCRTVRFADGVATLREEPGWVLLEVGPGQALGAWALQHPADGAPAAGTVFSSLRHEHNRVTDLRFVLETLGGLWTAGVAVDWAAFGRGERRHRVPLPGYPFERRRYWVDAPRTSGAGTSEAGARHEGAPAEDSGEAGASLEKGRDAMENRPAARVGSAAAASPRRDAILRDLRVIATGLTGIAEEHVATDADFFAAGFDSLLLLQAIQAIEKRMGVRLSLVELLEEVTTLDALAEHLDAILPPDRVLDGNALNGSVAPAAAEAREASAPAPLAEAPPSPAAAIPAPPAFYPAPPSIVPAAPDAGTSGGESALERLAARQLQFLAQQLEIVARETSPRGGNGAHPPQPATAPVFHGSASASPPALSAPPAASPAESVPAPRLATASAINGSASPFAIDGSASSAAAVAAPPAGGAERAVAQSPRAKIQPETFVAYQPLDTGKPGGMTPGEKAYLDDFMERYVARTRASKAHQARYHAALADSRVTARFRRAWKEITYPIVGARAAGSRVWDLDGNEYVDTGMAFGCNLFGHAPDFVVRAIQEQVESGFGVGPQSPHAGRAAELICELGGNERAVFCNSGTEAVMGAIRAARAFTGRSKIAMFAGSYHGWSDIVQGRLFTAGDRREVRPTAPGIPALPLGDVLLLDWDEPSSLDLLARHLDEIALVMVEPVQSRRFDIQPRAFLHELRAMTRARGALLHFDELITGFRILPGGAQAYFGVDADLVTYGKIVAGGLPMGVVAGRREVMDVFDGGAWRYGDDSYPTAQRTLFAGAFFKHPVSMAVAVAILEEIRRQGTPMYDALNERSARLVARLNAFFDAGRFPVSAVNFGSCFRLFFGPEVRFPDLFNHHLILEGIHVIQETGTHFLCTAHTDADLEKVFQAFRASAEAMRSGGFIPDPPDSRGSGAGSRATPMETAPALVARAPGSDSSQTRDSSAADPDPAIDSPPPPERAGEGVRVLPLSEGQRQLWIESQMGDEAGCAYIESTSIRLHGGLDADALRRALQALVDRHDTLRITLAPEGDAQLVHPVVRVELPVTDFRGVPPEAREARVEAWVRRTVERPFDLARGPLVRFALAALDRDEHLLVFDWHHAALDGWSFGVVWTDLCALYAAAREGRDAALPPRRDHAELVRAQAAVGGDGAAAEAYWTERFADGGPVLDLPADRPRPPARSYRGGRAMRVMDAALMYRLAAMGRTHGLTLFNTVLSAAFAWLSRLSGQDDLVVGTPSAGQAARGGAAELVGYGINVLPIRASVGGEATFLDLAKQVRRAVLGAVEHQGFSFPRLVETVLRGRDPSRPPLFSVMVDLDRAAEPAPLGELRADFARNFSGGSKLDLNLELLEAPDGLRVACDYSTDLFDRATIERWVAVLERVLEQVAEAPETRISRLRLAGAEDRQRVVDAWNRTDRPFPRDACTHHLFEAQAEHAPDALALAWGGESLTYAELDARANRLAHQLLRLGVGPEARVGLLLERGVEMVVATLAVMKAGGCCVPVDTSYPPERMELMLADSAVRVLLSQGGLAGPLAGSGLHVVHLDAAADALAAAPSDRPRSGVSADDLAYVFYTSGSTGRPKGVMMGHREVVQLAACVTECMPMGPGDRVAQASNASFDAAVFEIWCALANGAALVGIDRDVLLSAPALGEALRAGGITHLYQTAALFGQHVRERVDVYASLKQLVFGAEAVDTESVRRMLRHGRPRRVLHEYGPTEATVWCTLDVVEAVAEGAATVPIGRPIPNARAYVVDSALEPLPPGVPGELYVGGAGVVRGYLGRPGLTAERFVPDPFAAGPGARMYRTGDRARWRADGKLEFMGRFDHQVKLRGFRIEPGEVEGALSSCPGVREARVIVREDAPGDRRLVAYVAGEPDADALRAHLAGKLPEYMVPQAFVRMDRLPLTPNGKLDRAALPAPGRDRDEDRYVAPRTPTEEVLAEIWAEVLRLYRVGIRENFFELGGHSLLATRVVSRIRQVLQVEVPLRALFEGATVARLAERVEALRRADPARLPPVVPVDRARPLPLSFAQERLWFLDRLQPGGVFYNLPFSLRLRGALDGAALERALGEIVRRHEVLRTTFQEQDGGPVQVIAPFTGFALPVDDLAALGEDEREAEIRRRAGDDAARPFDLAAGPLFRARLIRLGDEDHALLLSMHHVAGDEWSLRVFFRELAALYAAYRDGGESPLPELPVQYADYAVWQRERLRGEALDRQVAYWKGRLADAPALLELPADRPRPAVQAHRGAQVPVALPGALLEGLQALGRREGATLYMVLLGAFQVLLSKYAGSEDVVVGSPVAGRTRAETEALIGFFVNTLVMRTDLSGDPSFREVLGRVREATLGAWEHQDAPFERLVEELQPERSLSHSPLFQVMFALRDGDGPWDDLAGMRAGPVETELDASKFDLTLVLGAEADGLRGVLEYATGLFDRGTIERMARHLERVLEQAAADAAVRLSGLDLLDAAERRLVVEAWNRTDAAPPPDALVHELFEEQAARNPGAVAVAFGDAALTYGELDGRANRLARLLRRRGVGPEVRVAVCAERGPELIVSLLAVLKAGGAYVPLDPAYPAERLERMRTDSGAAVLLTQEKLRTLLPARAGVEPIAVDAAWAEIAAESAERVESGATARSVAYVVYTSGSTGTPKGVAVEHGGLASLCAWHARAFAITPADRGTQLASPGFDAGGWEVWPYLAQGAAVDVVPNEVRADPEELRDWLVRRGATVAFVPTPVAEPMLGLEWPRETALRWLLAGGDRLRARPAAHLPFTVSNNYGPTECTVVATSGVVEADGARTPAIGGPIDHTRACVLDARMQPVPIGIPGELFVGGAQVARGYLHRPGLTAERFLPDPFGREPGARLYRTGDRVRWLDDASLEFLGRVDEQVKVRGFRIEPGEIEAALRRHPAVRECVVVARGDGDGETRLAAYVVGEGESAAELRAHLRATLPEHMVPAAFVSLDALPMTPNGKLDRKALPVPEPDCGNGEFDEPRNPVEAQLILLWEELLGVDGIGATQSFFDLGGNSLLAVRLFRQANRALDCDLPVATLFSGATVRHMAEAILQQKRAVPSSPASVVPLQPRGSLPPLFAVHSADRDVLGYVNLARHLGADQPVFGVRDVGADLARRVDRMAAEHLAAIRAVQPRGPYHLLSWSYGGLVVFEMALQLERAGETAAFVGLMDTPAPVLMDAWPWAGPVDSMVTLAHDVAARMRRPFSMTAKELEGLEWDEQLRRVAEALRVQGAAPAGFDAETLGEQCRIVRDRIRSRDGYVPGRFSGTLTLFRASEIQEGMDAFLAPYTDEEQRTLAWSRYSSSSVEVHVVPGAHPTLGSEPHVRVLAQRVRESLAAARERSAGGAAYAGATSARVGEPTGFKAR